ncbi:Uncharacterised protein [BD1-7 clade bacterium]|uniref:Uncharacterized protein n=1 Tax=BD1-7 clade bacterium TaxID=2029982 RepID=A0A5S9PJ44_9GAMM|nr:Uncharacterised protein [BD1-7 clade bacterium]
MARSIPLLFSRCFNRRFVSFPIIVDTHPVFSALFIVCTEGDCNE